MKKTFFSNAFLFTFLALIISSFSIMEAEARRGKTVGKKPIAKEKTAQECKVYTDRVANQFKIVQQRYYDLLLDRHSLYSKHNSIKNAHPVQGSYQGHIKKYKEARGDLGVYVREANNAKCKQHIPKDTLE